MSFNAVAKAVEIPLSGNLKLVFILMANYADEKDCCYPSQPTLARQAGVSIKTIQRVIEKLEELGFVKTLRKGTGNKSSLYQLIFYLGSSQNVAPDNLSGSQIVHPDQSNYPPRPVKLSTQGSQIVHRSYQDTINDPINEPINNTDGAKKPKKVSALNPETVDLPEYVDRKTWIAYCRMRKAKRAEIKTEETLEKCLSDLEKFSGGDPQKAIAVLERSIGNTWTGLFEIKNYSPVNPNKPNAHTGFQDRKYTETIPDFYADAVEAMEQQNG